MQGSATRRAGATNPLALPNVLACIVAHPPRVYHGDLHDIGLLAPCGQESTAEGAAPGCCFIGSLARAAVNEARGTFVSVTTQVRRGTALLVSVFCYLCDIVIVAHSLHCPPLI